MVGIKDENIDKTTIFVISVLLASLAINLFIRCGFDFEYLQLTSSGYSCISSVSYATSVLYILVKRLKQFVLIIIFMKIFNTELVYNCLTISLSFIFGIFVTIQTYYSGLSGVIELLLYLLPHYIFYLILFCLVYKHYKNWTKDNFQPSKIMFFLVLFCAGVICEGFFSRFFLDTFYQYIVINL